MADSKLLLKGPKFSLGGPAFLLLRREGGVLYRKGERKKRGDGTIKWK